MKVQNDNSLIKDPKLNPNMNNNNNNIIKQIPNYHVPASEEKKNQGLNRPGSARHLLSNNQGSNEKNYAPASNNNVLKQMPQPIIKNNPPAQNIRSPYTPINNAQQKIVAK